MKTSPFAGKMPDPSMLVDVPKLVTAYYTQVPDPVVREQRVAFGTSGHRGSARCWASRPTRFSNEEAPTAPLDSLATTASLLWS
ncbi:MAG TPA: hypothetical protein VFA32_15285 [Dehalococcoidia bacterium]|jgi:hypothetical protein|nr:hypothetical protein [Dehalococcoidia bacterium]